MERLKSILKWSLLTLGGLAVLYLAVSATQVSAARRTQTVHRSITVNAPVDAVWQLVSNVGDYHNVTTDALHKVVVDGSRGVNMKRTCFAADGSQWDEVCTAWKENDHYTFVVDTDADDYPLPLVHVDGTWGIKPISEDSCEVYIVLNYQAASPWLHWLFIPSANEQLSQGFEYTLATWKELAESEDALQREMP